MVFLDLGNHAELGSQCRKTFLFCGFGKAGVHIRPLVILAVCGSAQVCSGVPDALELLEPHLGVFLLIVRGLQEQGSDLLVAFLLRDGGEIGILVPCLGFT